MTMERDKITENIIGAAFEVYNELGYGFLEKVYQRAMQVELTNRDLKSELESEIEVRYKGIAVGDYRADLFVENSIIAELKISKEFNPKDQAQVLNQLKATGIKIGMLINFGQLKVEFKRLIN